MHVVMCAVFISAEETEMQHVTVVIYSKAHASRSLFGILVNNGITCSLPYRDKLWIEEEVFQLSEQIFKAAPLRVLHPLLST